MYKACLKIKRFLIIFIISINVLLLQACQTMKVERSAKNLTLAPGQSDVANVLPSQFWQDSGISVLKGQTYQLKTVGMWSFGGICGVADAEGKGNAPLCDGLVGNVPGASNVALVAKVGENGNAFLVGHGVTITPSFSGKLLLGPNAWDWLPGDNTGKMTVTITRNQAQFVKQKPKKQPIIQAPQTSALLPAIKGMIQNSARIALVIGNSDYKVSGLPNPVNDARLMTHTLRNLGFSVLHEENASQRKMKFAINRFGDHLERAGKNAVGLFYYAGHGIQVDGRNYLIPIDANIQNEKDVDVEAVTADAALAQMNYAGNNLNVMILDACRNNPFKRSFRSSDRGLALMNAPSGSLIAYATGPGSVAADGVGQNSPYTLAVTQAMLNKNTAIERMFRNVRNQVMVETNDKQVPWEASSLIGGDFFFNPSK